MTTALQTYMQAAGIADAEFAVSIKRDRTMVSKLRRGLIKPTLDTAAVIEEVTGGAVPMQAWVTPEELSPAGAPPPFPSLPSGTDLPEPGSPTPQAQASQHMMHSTQSGSNSTRSPNGSAQSATANNRVAA